MKEGAESYVKVAHSEDPMLTQLVMQIKNVKRGTDMGAQLDCDEEKLFN